MNKPENIADFIGLKITIADAAKYTPHSEKELLSLAKDHYLAVVEGNIPEKYTDEEIPELAKNTWILLTEIEQESAQKWLIDNIAKENFVSLDFAVYQTIYGKKATENLQNTIALMKDIEETTHDNALSARTLTKDDYLESLGLTASTYYASRAALKKIDNRAIQQFCKFDESRKFESLCHQSKGFLFLRGLDFNAADKVTIFEDLKEEKKSKGVEICEYCPYNPKTEQYQKAVEEVNREHPECKVPKCITPGKGMIIPDDVSTIRRFMDTIPESFVAFENLDEKEFKARYGYKVTRVPETVVLNRVFCDHIELDVLLHAGNDSQGNPILRKPWATIMSDAASGAIIGSVLSFFPNRTTIGQCFARAVTVKPDSIFMGVPHELVCDRGRDFKSSFIASNDRELKKWNQNNNFANRGYFDNGLLDILGTKITHCKAYEPWQKAIERTNKEINKLIHRVPGYVGGKKIARFKTKRQNEIDRLMKKHRITDLKTFAAKYWYPIIIQKYNNYSYRGKMSPLEKYRTLPHADTIVPDYNTLSVYLIPKKKCYVYPNGIYCNKNHYYHPSLAEFIVNGNGTKDKSRKVTVYTLDPNYDDSIFVVYCNPKTGDNRFICEAFKRTPLHAHEKNKWTVAKETVYKNLQTRTITDKIEVIQYLSEVSKINLRHYIDETFTDPIVTVGETTAGANADLIYRGPVESTEARLAELKRTVQILEEGRQKSPYFRLNLQLRKIIRMKEKLAKAKEEK